MVEIDLVFEEDGVCIVIPTFRRSEGLRDAIESLFGLSGMNQSVRILVVDNNPTPIEKPLVAEFSKKFKHDIEYISEPSPGVSNARYAAMTATKGCRYVAFLDDDMRVGPDWLSALLRTSKDFKAGLVFGPTYAVMPNKDDPCNSYMEPFFARTIDKDEDGLIDDTLGTSGCLLDLNYCQISTPAFDPKLNERGGEDDIFFDHLRQTGTRVAWSAEAVSYEIVQKSRATPSYVWKRNFGYGQAPTRIHANRGVNGLPGILYYMSTGCLQLAAYLPNLIIRRLLNRPSQSKYLALTARALGKALWIEKLTPRLYGGANS